MLWKKTSIWSFPQRGEWATHDAKWRGNWSPYIPRNIILRYSNEGDTVLDQFAGGGTTLVEAKLLRRNVVGVDVNEDAIKSCCDKTSFQYGEASGEVYIRKGDARNLAFIPDNSVDLICTHPPYANIIRYSDEIEGDLSRLSVVEFLCEMKKVAAECYRVLKNGKYCAILIGDTRKHGHIVPLSFEVMKLFEGVGFSLKEIIIKEQHNCRGTGRWTARSEKDNFLLIAHEYLFVFDKRSTK